jgi:hypothetical protein
MEKKLLCIFFGKTFLLPKSAIIFEHFYVSLIILLPFGKMLIFLLLFKVE